MSATLVAFFSASGVTERVAHNLARAAENADVFQIKPAVPYSLQDLDWHNPKSRSSVEMEDNNSRPEIADKVQDMAKYAVLFLGFPIWWYRAPRIIETFLEQYNLAGKKIIPFATSGSSGMGKTEEYLKPLAPDAAWLPGRRLAADVSVDELRKWITELGL